MPSSEYFSVHDKKYRKFYVQVTQPQDMAAWMIALFKAGTK